MSQTLTAVPKLKFSEPKHNLPGRKGRATAEDRFTIAFMRAYLRRASEIHRGSPRNRIAFAREIPVNGYGIADLLVVAWNDLKIRTFADTPAFIEKADPCARAFECKLTNWRKAMSQAGRYRFFSNQAVVVLPQSAAEKAVPFLDTFKKIRVGLWSFSPENERIIAYHTPRPSKARSAQNYSRAIHGVRSASRRSLPIPRRG
jgi:hypothetical protein